MKISIITATKNNKEGLIRAIECVRSQTYENIEHVIIDGGSTDGSAEVLKQVQGKALNDRLLTTHYSLLTISEADSGIYDAINKGIKLATGEVIGLLHSDDLYANENVITKYASVFNQPTTDNKLQTIAAVYSDLVYVKGKQEVRRQKLDSGLESGMTKRTEAVYSDLVYVKGKQEVRRQKLDSGSESGMTIEKIPNPIQPTNYSLLTTNYSIIRYWKAHSKSVNSEQKSVISNSTSHNSLIINHSFHFGWMPPHPTLFIRKEIFEKYGLYDTSFKIAADYEMILRLFYKHKISSYYLPLTSYLMSIGGTSNKSIGNIIQKSKEDYLAMKLNGIFFPLFTLVSKNIRKLPQFLARDL